MRNRSGCRSERSRTPESATSRVRVRTRAAEDGGEPPHSPPSSIGAVSSVTGGAISVAWPIPVNRQSQGITPPAKARKRRRFIPPRSLVRRGKAEAADPMDPPPRPALAGLGSVRRQQQRIVLQQIL